MSLTGCPHAAGADFLEYWLPNDGEEQDRQDFQHEWYRRLHGGRLGFAPLESPRFVLDIGTGTGIWAMEFAEDNPASLVIGTDLSTIQPEPQTTNCQFVLENSELHDWQFLYPFDYVHLRNMGPCFQDIRTVFRKAWNNMSSGGWIEIADLYYELFSIDDSHHGSCLDTWAQLLNHNQALIGRTLNKAPLYPEFLRQTGFVNIHRKEMRTPISPWVKDPSMKQLGMFMGKILMIALESYRKILVEGCDMSAAEVEDLISGVRAEVLDLRNFWYIKT